MIHGEQVILFFDQHQVACATSCEVNVDHNTLQVCSPVSGRYRSYVSADCGWTASVGMMVLSAADPQEWLQEMKSSASPLTLRYFDDNLRMYQVGQCYIQNFAMSAKVGSICTYSINLQGTGELRIADDRDYPFVWRDTMFTNKPMDSQEPNVHNIDGSVVSSGENKGDWSKATTNN